MRLGDEPLQTRRGSFLGREILAYFHPSPLPHPIPLLLVISGVLLSLLIDVSIAKLAEDRPNQAASSEHEPADSPSRAEVPESAPAQTASSDTARLLWSRSISLPIDIAAVLMILAISGYSPALSLGLRLNEIPRSLGYGVCLAILWMPIIFVLNVAARVLFRPDHPHPAFELFHSGDLWSVLLVGLTAVILAPVLEELLFRGLLLSGLSPFVGPWTAILLTGALFGLAHTSVWPDPIPLTVLGIALGLAMCRTGSLWTPIFFHGFFNGSMLLLSLIVK